MGKATARVGRAPLKWVIRRKIRFRMSIASEIRFRVSKAGAGRFRAPPLLWRP